MYRWLISFLFHFAFMWADEPGAAGATPPGDSSGGSGAVNLEGAGASKSIPGLGGNASPLSAIDLKSIIPAEFAEKGYLKDIIAKNDFIGLLNQLDNAQSLIGKKLGIPGPESTPEEKAKFFEALGKPKAHTEYAVKREGMDDKTTEYFQKLFHSADLSKGQADKIMAALDQMGKDNSAAMEAAGKANDEAFDKLVTDTFGERADEAIANAKAFMAKYVPKELHAKMDEASNEVLVAVATLVDNIVKTYTREDNLLGGNKGITPPPFTADEIQGKMSELYNSPDYRDAFSAGHTAALAKEKDLKEKLITVLSRRK